uniref:NADH-ubiquinone oxidoreductase chain 1 n=1 Tax=Rectidens sumatrensis TaxID=1903498 RepID=A0A8A3WLM8_9BIVA|nr:NADH dehydrogenase subunit 1 [Rectidens sumatrensis]
MWQLICVLIQSMSSAILALVAMAFLTLLERKSLAYMQLRKGPNKLGFIGLPQPLADAVKLLIKETVIPTHSNPTPMLMAPLFALTLAIALWFLYPTSNSSMHKSLGLLLLISISATAVYPVLMSGWSANSKYSLFGAMRVMAQSISYEIPMILTFIFFALVPPSLDIAMFTEESTPKFSWQLSIPMAYTMLISLLAETNRTPFDFAEGESELVSGFNVEYSGVKFAMLFMAEYLNMLFMSLIASTMLVNSTFFTPIFAFLFLLVRGTMPRHRYDLMMTMAWESLLPVTLTSILSFSLLFPLL